MASKKQQSEEIETLAERQENELQVLQSIYQDAVTDLRDQDAWKVVRPPEVKMLLQPQESMTNREVYNSIVLYIKCPVNYPEEVPEIQLENPKGISDQHVLSLKAELRSLSNSLVGEVMILELAQQVEKFLHAHNKPPTKSFYDDMMSRKKLQEEQEEQKRQESLARLKEKEEKQRKKIEEEIHRRQDALREETRRRRQEAKQSCTDGRNSVELSSGGGSDPPLVTPIPKDTEQRKRSSVTPERQAVVAESGSYQKPERRRRTTSTPKKDSESEGDSGKCTDHAGVVVLAFNTKKERMVHRGRCLGHSVRGCTQYAGMDTDSGELVLVTEWTLQWRNPKRKLDLDDQEQNKEQVGNYLKQVCGIESEFMSLLRLHHQNLTHYLAFKYDQSNGGITVHILSEFISGGSLAGVLHSKMPLPMEQVRYYTAQLVNVLNYLHEKAVVHKNLRLSSAMIDPHGNIRLADYSIDNRLAELYAAVDATRPGVHFASEKPLVPGRSGKKADVYMLGIMLLSLAQGVVVTEQFPDIPPSLPQEVHDFLSKCLVQDERSRWSAAQLQEHVFVKTPIHRKLSDMKSDQDQSKQKNKDLADEDDDDPVVAIPFIPSSDSGQSRLKNEFEILRWLGKGGFGDVIKVRNKLDGRFYAIKRIPLNPRSKHFTRKITREVKLLSRLSHENVVRYYNSWIEVSEEPALSDSTSAADTTTPDTPSPAKPVTLPARLTATANLHNSLGLCDNIELDAPAAATMGSSLDWSVSLSSSRQRMVNDSSSSDEDEVDDDDDDENDVFGLSFGASFLGASDSQDDSIVFDHEDTTDDVTSSELEKSEKDTSIKSPISEKADQSTVLESPLVRLQFLYIQMEFCEKSTLRDCIDNGLYQDRDRVWRLFREITEGLSHIHRQGMIHRDLKPVNIFLDFDDQVKIGDFGLATTDILSQQQSSFMDLNVTPALNLDPRVSTSKSESLGDGNLTGKVGTALYVSPEMMNTSSRTHYNQKVDIYSLGVMFFEMCYPPLPTGMERVKVLTALREPSIALPEDFDPENDMQNQVAILKLLLTHDPTLRPTADQLLACELLPPPHMEEAELTEVLRSTLSQPDTKAYRHMISAIFGQRVDPATDFTYDIDLHKLQSRFTPSPLLVQRSVTETLERLFEKHGALRITTPLLMPKTTLYEYCEQYVSMMDFSGGLISLPYDLRVPFARYVARNNVTSVKRYSIERVYRQKRFANLHPRELVECAVDIVTPTPASFIPDAELLHIASDLTNEFPVLKKRNYFLRLNHAKLLRAVFLHCGIAEELYYEVCNILSDVRAEGQQKLQVQTRLGNLSLSDDAILSLYRFIENEGPYGKVASMLRCITKTKGLAASYAKQGLHEMEAVISHAESLGCKLQPVLAVGLVYNMHYYSGTVYQVAASIRRKNRTTLEVLAAGGRYDDLVAKCCKVSSALGHHGVAPGAVGISISFERLIAARQDDPEWHSRGIVDIVVASLGHKPLNKEKLSVASELWGVGLRTHVVYDFALSLEEIQDLGRAMGASQVVLLKDLDSGYAKVRSLEKDKVTEKKVQMSDLTNYLQQKVASANCEIPESLNAGSGVKLSSQMSQGSCETWGGGAGPVIYSGSGSGSGSGQPPVNITIITSDKSKLALNTKRRYEAQIYANITSVVSTISNKMRIEVLAVELVSTVLKTIAANLEVGQDEANFESSITSIMEKHARRDDKKYLNKIFEEIHDLKFATNRNGSENRKKLRPSVIVLYGLKEDLYRVLV